jgi:hypothetical protein
MVLVTQNTKDFEVFATEDVFMLESWGTDN